MRMPIVAAYGHPSTALAWQKHSPTTSLRKTIQPVATQRLTALNVHDLAARKSNAARPEVFYFKGYQIGLFFSVSITSAISLPAENRSRFLEIEEAIWRYSREHGHLVNASKIEESAVLAPETMRSEADANIPFEEPISL